MRSHDKIGIAWLFEAGHQKHLFEQEALNLKPSAIRMNQVRADITRLQYWNLPCRVTADPLSS